VSCALVVLLKCEPFLLSFSSTLTESVDSAVFSPGMGSSSSILRTVFEDKNCAFALELKKVWLEL